MPEGANIDEVISDLLQVAKECGEKRPTAQELVEQLAEFGIDTDVATVRYYL